MPVSSCSRGGCVVSFDEQPIAAEGCVVAGMFFLLFWTVMIVVVLRWALGV